MSRVPKGRLSGGPMSAVPSGLVGLCMAKPDVKTDFSEGQLIRHFGYLKRKSSLKL